MAQTNLAPTRSPGLFSRVRRWEILRLIVYSLGLIATLVASKLISNPLVPPAPAPSHHLMLLLSNLVSAGLLLAAYALLVRLIEQRPASELGLRKGAGLFVVGAVIGVALMAAVYLILWSQHRVTVSAGTGLAGLGGDLALYFAAAVLEELVMRAVVFRLVEQMSGTTVAVIFSAALFGLLHAMNPGATLVSSAAIALEAGVLLAVAYALTRNLWFVIGIHLGWNFAEGGLFGAKVSGGAVSHALMRTTISGPDLISGGGFGPEASLVSVGLLVVVSALIGLILVRRAGWRPMVWAPVAA